MRIALAQTNPTIGDLAGNAARMAEFAAEAARAGAELVVFPELAICGYPPRDLLSADRFVAACVRELDRVGREAPRGLTVVAGTPLPMDREHPGRGTHNSLLVYHDGECLAHYDKQLLPTYDVFDEDRYFEPGRTPRVIEVGGRRVGLAICEDLWKGEDAGFASRYASAADPVAALTTHGAEIIVVPSASPFVLGKNRRHRDILRAHARRHGLWVCSVNQVGGNDDLLFDGHACVVAPDGSITAAAPGFDEHLLLTDLHFDGRPGQPVEDPATATPDERLVWDALTLGVRDYVTKCGFRSVVLGISGGIDSALVAAIAARALGPGNVLGVRMPGAFSSEHSLSDAAALAEALGIGMTTVPIQPGFEGIKAAVDPAFAEIGRSTLGQALPDLTQENLQSRVRGAIIMAVSNRTGALVLTTGNKSEVAVGYCTLYGDMNGGLAVLSDIPKTMVYRLSRYANTHHAELGFPRPPIPEASITKPPSAELAPDQLDSDSLPPYEVLDVIVERAIEHHQSADRIIADTGIDADTVRRVCRLIDRNEYKRQQLAVGLKVTTVAFGSGRRVPIAQRWTR
jgi:NAD+ synthetase